ncbi:MAG: DUF1499 domain-containing protein [Phenylobacterium sp.]|uniref:DUF1499 domain-containing protein n=1 Tax=Phenylobacterium sp. TaxID=1871053 RepID=UPI0027228061|nr:DUF1499 domain-containing protein [Phenylobacterium sp.]MDO8914186.1 DUF1499 domain-containing protein [Phenylobacterium sp.]MDP2012215.1 DUF1499 domain-containing protein [Phenylobacterium sp.]MDP3101509.1 DUF1499 domain-containing protein [Phenylobacterium sp.]MDP3870519.1 DUF1499 domain-containing protein [Phenylobacterium sp.]
MRFNLARLSLAVSLLIPVYFMAAALGVKFGLWPWQFGLGVLIAKFALPVLGIGLALALIALIACLVRAPRRGWAIALAALLIPALGVGYLATVRARGAAIPPIHDIATNVVDPPIHSARVLADRQAQGANPVNALSAKMSTLKPYQAPQFAALGPRTLGEVGQAAYPAVKTLAVSATPAATYDAAQAQARAEGWTLAAGAPSSGVIEATAETFWFGFKDDVAVRIRRAPDGEGSLVDVRSTSRVGLSDLGANAARIEAYLAGLSKRLAKG